MTFKGPWQKPLGPCSPHQRPQLGMPLRSPHSPRLRPARLLGANPNTRSTPMGPSQGPWGHNAGDWGPPGPSARLTLPPGRHPGPSGHRQSFRVGEQEGPSKPPVTFQGPCNKTLGPTLHLPSALTSARLSLPCTSLCSNQQASWGLALSLGWPQRGPSQGAWHRNAGDWGPEPQRQTHSACRQPPP